MSITGRLTVRAAGLALLLLLLSVSSAYSLDSFAPPASPLFPIVFEPRGSNWIAQGPAYRLALHDGNASLTMWNARGQVSRLGMQVLGVRNHVEGVPASGAVGRHNYLTGSDPQLWRTNVELRQAVRFANVIDGLDIIYRGGTGPLEYDLEVAPGMDVNAIQLAWSGAESMTLDDAGNLLLHTSAGDLVQRKPVTYQCDRLGRRSVPSSFRLQNGILSFFVGPYDHSKPLVIDPIIDYATWFPAPITLVAVDSSGATYVSGSVAVPVLPVTLGAYQGLCGTDGACNTPASQLAMGAWNSDVFVAKFSPDGSTLLFCTYLGGSGNDVPLALAVDKEGNVAVGGTTTSRDFPVTSGLDSTPTGTGTSTFATKLKADGTSLIWSTLVPSAGLTDLAADANGDVFLLTTPGGAAFTTPDAIATGGTGRWLGALDVHGNLRFATYVPGLMPTTGRGGLAVSADGTVWIGGTTLGDDLTRQPSCPGVPANLSGTPAVLVGVDVAHPRIVQTLSIGGTVADWGTSLALDSQGNFYLAGMTCSPDFPGIDPSRFPALFSIPGFVVKLAAGSGNRLWTWTADGPVWTVASDGSGNVAAIHSLGGPPQDSSTPEFPAIDFIDSSGKQVWTTESTFTSGLPLAMDPQGRIHALNTSTAVQGTPGAWQSAPSPEVVGTNPVLLMSILPVAGTLTVLPDNIDLTTGQANPMVFCADGMALPTAFTISTTTPWLGIWDGGQRSPPLVTPLPNWMGTTVPLPRLQMAASLFTPGSYDGSFTITAPGFANSPLTIPVHVTIPAPFTSGPALPPEIVIYASALGGGRLAPLLHLTPMGNQTITSATPWIRPTAAGKDALLDFSSLPSGINRGQVTVSLAGDPNSPYTVTVVVVFGETEPTSPNASPASLSFLAQPNDSAKHGSVAVWPAMSLRQSFNATAEASWATVSPASGSMPAVLVITVNPAGLQPGTYMTHIQITPGTAGNRGLRIPVSLTVRNSVPFNVDPAAVAVILPFRDAPPGVQAQTPVQQVPVTVSSAQPTTFSAGPEWFVPCLPAQTGSAPGSFTLTFDPAKCSTAFGYPIAVAGYFNVVSGANQVINIPVAMITPRLFPLIEPGGVVNGATFSAGPVAPASIVSIFGIDLSSFVNTAASVPLDNAPLWADPIYTFQPGYFYVSPQQWNIQLPSLDPGTYQVAIGSSALVSFDVAPTAPHIFVWNGNRAAALNSDYTLNQAGNPAVAGSALMVYLTGQGAVDPPVPDRFPAPAQPLSKTIAETTASIDGLPAAVQFSGLAPGYVGLAQVNIMVPSNLAPGEHTLVITIGGVQSNAVEVSTK